MKHLLKRTWAEINLDYIKQNYQNIKKITSENTKVMAVVKADGYGHGDVIVAKTLEDIGADWFGVSNIEEAILLRQGGISCDILIFGFTPPNMVGVLEKWNFTQTVYSFSYAKSLNIECEKQGLNINCHLKIDTGMGRIGLICNNKSDILNCVNLSKEIYNNFTNLKFSGIFTHFSSADETCVESQNYTKKQFEIFKIVYETLENDGFETGMKHCCNSAGTIQYQKMHLDMVRVGLLLYGLMPSEELKSDVNLKVSMTLKSNIALVKWIDKDSSISYGRKFTSDKKIRVATIPIGYADGFSRRFSNCGAVEINGKLAPILGNICMDQMMVDVTNIEAKEGDIAIIFGDGNDYLPTIDGLATTIGTINYEIITVLGKRVPRLYIKDGKEALVTTYKGMEYII